MSGFDTGMKMGKSLSSSMNRTAKAFNPVNAGYTVGSGMKRVAGAIGKHALHYARRGAEIGLNPVKFGKSLIK